MLTNAFNILLLFLNSSEIAPLSEADSDVEIVQVDTPLACLPTPTSPLKRKRPRLTQVKVEDSYVTGAYHEGETFTASDSDLEIIQVDMPLASANHNRVKTEACSCVK